MKLQSNTHIIILTMIVISLIIILFTIKYNTNPIIEGARGRRRDPAAEAREAAARAAREQAAREAAARAASEKAEREARERAERAAREARARAEREARERAAREKAAREKAEREAREKAEREAREKAAREAREKSEREERERKIDINNLKKGSFLNLGDTMKRGNILISNNGSYLLQFSSDGILSVNIVSKNQDNSPIIDYYKDEKGLKQSRFRSKQIWDSGIKPSDNATSLKLDINGNLTLLNDFGNTLWNTKTGCMNGTKLVIHDQGYIAIYRDDGTPIWSSRSPPFYPYNLNNLLPQCKGIEKMQNIKEGFFENYEPGDFNKHTNYPTDETLNNEIYFFEKETEVLNLLNTFNQSFAKHKRCKYQKDYNKSLGQNDCTGDDETDKNYSDKLNSLMAKMDDYIGELEKYGAKDTNHPTVDKLSSKHRAILTKRTELDQKLNELNNSINSVSSMKQIERDSTIYATLLWSTLAGSLVYYIFTQM